MFKLLQPFKGLPKEIYVLCFARMINATGMFIFPLLTLILTRKIGLSHSEAGFWIMMVGLTFIPSNLIGGKMTDLFGRKKLIVICETLGGLMYVICGFLDPSMIQIWLILSACFFFGMSEPANNAVIADLTTPENRDASYSLSYMGFNMGFAIGPAVGGLLFENHYPWIFWGDALTLFIAIALILLFVRETFGDAQADPGEGRALEQHMEGSIFKVLRERPILIAFSLILLFYNFSYSQWHYLLPLQLDEMFDSRGAALFGLLASLNGLVVMICTPLLTSIFRKKSNLKKVALGGIFYLLGFGMFGFIGDASFLYYALGCTIFTLGEILITTSFMPFITNRTPASHRGRMNAVIPLIMGIGYSMGPLLMGKGLGFYSIDTGWRLIGALMSIGVLMMLLLDRWDRKAQAKADETADCETESAYER